jgi:arylsulfatase A-like enzyme
MGLTHGDFAWDLYPDEKHLAQLLGSAGYTTALIGIMHEARSAERCGFHKVVPPEHGAHITDQTLTLLQEYANQQQPFYIQLGYHEPHRVSCPGEERPDYMGFVGDYIAPDDSLGVTVPPYLADTPHTRQELAELQGAVFYMDTALGHVLEGLRALGLEEQTLVIFTTDHGIALPRAKCTLYDPGLETALLMRLPCRGWSGGKTYTPLISNTDIMPTLLDLLCLPMNPELQGQSLLPLLEQGTFVPRQHIFAEMTYHDYYDPQRCIRTETHKLIVNFSAAPSFMNPSQSWQPRSRPVIPAIPPVAYHPLIELYDLQNDPFEQQNLLEEGIEQARPVDLLAHLYAWMKTTDDPLLQGAVTSPTHRRAVAVLERPLDETSGTE